MTNATMRRLFISLVAIPPILFPCIAHAIPAFAAQTGEPCSACHIGFPQLTPYGRDFKLEGYIAGGMFPSWKNIAIMSQTGYTQLHDKIAGGLKPGYKSNDAWAAAQQSSVYYGGAIDAKLGLGAFIQVTYDNVAKSWHWDNTDIRLAEPGTLFNKPLFYGFTFNNAPTVTDLWNSTPDWGYPFIHSYLAPSPVASPQVDQLAQEVYGFGAYAALNVTPEDMVYAEADLYKSLPNQMSYALGVGPATQDDGVIPYARLAFQRTWNSYSFELGGYGLIDNPYPEGVVSGATNHITDLEVDTQFQWIEPQQAFSLQASLIHESQDWNASYAQGLTSNRNDHLDDLTVTASELIHQTYGITESYNEIDGNPDDNLYPPGPISGNLDGKPDSRSWTTELDYYLFNKGGPAWLPWLNAKFFVEDTIYPIFNGGPNNYDGANRSAGANDTVFSGVWVAF